MRALAETTRPRLPATWPPHVVPLPENRSALVAVRRLATGLLSERPCRLMNPLVLHGPPGTGKTLLTNALHEHVAGQCSVTRLAAADWIPSDVEAISDDLRASDLLIVEDLQHLSERAANDLVGVLDYRLSRRRATVLTANGGPAELATLPARLVNRLIGGLVVGMRLLSVGSRRQLVQALAEQRGLRISDDVVSWLARNTPGSARQLVAAMEKYETLTESTGLPPTSDDLIEQFHDGSTPSRPTLESIAQRVAEKFRISRKELRGRNRQPQTLWPRHVSMYLARRLTTLSFARIGEYFDRDHSTVRHACQKVAESRVNDLTCSALLDQLAAEFGSELEFP